MSGIVSVPPRQLLRCSAAAGLELLLTLPTTEPPQPDRYVLRYKGTWHFGCPRRPAHLAGMDAFRNKSKASTLDLRHHSEHLCPPALEHPPSATSQPSSARRTAQLALSPAPELDGDCERMGSPPCRPQPPA